MFIPARKGPAPATKLTAALGEAGRAMAERVLGGLPGHAPTPLHTLAGLAAECGVAAIHVKDEGRRFALKSFKALGGAYAVVSLVLDEASCRLGRAVVPTELGAADVRAVAATMTFACATDGNHGRSVAWGASLAGAACEIFIHAGVSEGRAAAIAAYGAHINRVDGSYDDSIVRSAEMSAQHGWILVSDTAWDGYEDIPLTVMQGYTVMAGEALDAMAEPPTHIFLQAGVGGMAAAVAAYAAQRLGAAAPKVVVVEPARAACVAASTEAGRPVTIPHGEATIMAMLECATPSPLGWQILHHLADACVTLEEEEAVAAMRALAYPAAGDPAIVAGESGATGLAGLLSCLRDPTAKEMLGLDRGSRILVFNSEGATDPAIYAALVGRNPEEIGR
ncbi:MAG TPA: diaminopropionate ammonia-lyase [Rhizobiales bacterium]|nr:diaminopropionate ammonia-lyase [Hyphomicrobiales bacterium]